MSYFLAICLPAKFARRGVAPSSEIPPKASTSEQGEKLDRQQLTELFHDVLGDNDHVQQRAS